MRKQGICKGFIFDKGDIKFLGGLFYNWRNCPVMDVANLRGKDDVRFEN